MGMTIRAPVVGWATQAVLHRWWQEDGDWVQVGTPLCTLRAGAFYHTMCSLQSGFLRVPAGQLRQPGTTVQRGMVLGFVEAPGEWHAEPTSELPVLPPSTTSKSLAALVWDERLWRLARQAAAGKPAVSPRARQRLQLTGATVQPRSGSGLGGALREKDLPGALHAPVAGSLVARAVVQSELSISSDPTAARQALLVAVLRACELRFLSSWAGQPGAVARWLDDHWVCWYPKSVRHALKIFTTHSPGQTATCLPSAWSSLPWVLLDMIGSPFTLVVPPLPQDSGVLIHFGTRTHWSDDFDPSSSRTPRHTHVSVTLTYNWDLVSLAEWAQWVRDVQERFSHQ